MTKLKDPSNLTKTAKAIKALQYKEKYCKILQYFPEHDNLIYKEDGSIDYDKSFFSREKYKQHLSFFAAGATHNQRLFLAANRVGKSNAAAYELTCHLTGIYPIWWVGKRFDRSNIWWVVGETAKSVQQTLQVFLLGNHGDFGSGMIPKDLLDFETMTDARKANTPISTFKVKHVSGGFSQVEFRSYDQGPKAFAGTERSIWVDEQCPIDVYNECLTRTSTGGNIIMMTFTPLEGLTPLIEQFTNNGDYSEGEKGPSRYLVPCTWDDAPHLTTEKKAELLAGYPEFQRDARTKGIPQLGAGAIYPHPEETWLVPAFKIPDHFERVFAIDFGWKDPTAILWAALDPETQTWYVYDEHYMSNQPPAIHASIILSKNAAAKMVIPGICDPSGGGTSPKDGRTSREIFHKEHDLIFTPANNSLEPGIGMVNDYFAKGKIKIFETCFNFRREYKLYRRSMKTKKPQGADHLLDDLRYIVLSGKDVAKSRTIYLEENTQKFYQDWEVDAIHYHKDAWLYT